MEFVIAIAAIILAIGLFIAYSNKKRREYLMSKYGDIQLVERLMERAIWQGMSEEQLVDSRGRPEAKDEKVYKTKIRETFKYNQTGKNRFRNRVYVENGIVVGWEEK